MTNKHILKISSVLENYESNIKYVFCKTIAKNKIYGLYEFIFQFFLHYLSDHNLFQKYEFNDNYINYFVNQIIKSKYFVDHIISTKL